MGDQYGPDRQWRYRHKRSGFEKEYRISLSWEVHLDPISDDYLPSEADAGELWDIWIRRVDWSEHSERYGIPLGAARIFWFVAEAAEFAPFVGERPDDEDFLTHFTWPVDAVTGEPMQWSRLPVIEKRWTAEASYKGGFIQEATGWKPSAFQPWVDVRVLAQAARLPRPRIPEPDHR